MVTRIVQYPRRQIYLKMPKRKVGALEKVDADLYDSLLSSPLAALTFSQTKSATQNTTGSEVLQGRLQQPIWPVQELLAAVHASA